MTSHHTPRPWEYEQAADGRLIAAAPDLLAALRRLHLAAIAREATSGDPAGLIAAREELLAATREASAAIARATA